MKSLELSDADLSEMKLFYEQELDNTERKLKHIKRMLDQLSDVSSLPTIKGSESLNGVKSEEAQPIKKRKRKKKRAHSELFFF